MTVTAGDGGAEPPGSLSGTVLRGAAVSGLGYVLTQLLTLGFYVALARLATPAEFGELAAGMVLVGIGALFTESGMLSALIHRRDRIEEAAATAVASTFLTGVGLGLVALAASPLIGAIFDSDTVASVAAATAGVLTLQALQVVPEALLQRRFSFVRRIIVEPVSAIAFGVTAIVLTANGLGVWGLVAGFYAAAASELLFSWGLLRWRPQLRLASVSMWRELIAYGRYPLAGNLVIRGGEQLPIFLLGRFTGLGALGQFRYATRIASTPLSLIMAAASYVLFPAFARIATDRERFHAAFLRSLRWMAVLAVPAGLLLIPLGKPLAVLVFGPAWSGAGTAIAGLALFCTARALASTISEAVKAEGRPDVVMRMNVVEVAVGAVAMIALLPLGLIGVAVGISVGAIARGVYAFRRFSEIVGVSLGSMLAELRAPVLAGLGLVAAITPLELLVDAPSHGTALGLALVAGEALLGLCLYGLLVHLLAPGSLRELLGLIRTARRRGDDAPPPGPNDQMTASSPSGVEAAT